ncbi:MAG: 50S ribosomal protein L9 [Phycisphaerae bacterium]|nr:50S ribosomal protein L9 [Phycisphaerae bacterium]
MKVLLRRNVVNLGRIGEVVEVKDGYARNYLIPQQLGVAPTEGNLKRVEAEKEEYLKELARVKSQLEAKAAVLEGKEITISARANADGHLYGSVGPAQIVAMLAAEGIFIEPANVILGDPIRTLDKYDVRVRFGEDVTATIHVWVVPIREEGDDEGEADETADDQE